MRQQGMYMRTLHERHPSPPQKRPQAPTPSIGIPDFDRGVAPDTAAPLPPLDVFGVQRLHAFLATFMLRGFL